MQHCFLLPRKSRDFWGPRWGIAIANRKNRCDFGALSTVWKPRFTDSWGGKNSGPKKPWQPPWPSNPCFFGFPCFFRFPISLAFLCVFLSFARISWVQRRETPLLFSGFPLLFFKKARVGGSGISRKFHTAEGWCRQLLHLAIIKSQNLFSQGSPNYNNCHENTTQLVRNVSNRVTVIKHNSTMTRVLGG